MSSNSAKSILGQSGVDSIPWRQRSLRSKVSCRAAFLQLVRIQRPATVSVYCLMIFMSYILIDPFYQCLVLKVTKIRKQSMFATVQTLQNHLWYFSSEKNKNLTRVSVQPELLIDVWTNNSPFNTEITLEHFLCLAAGAVEFTNHNYSGHKAAQVFCHFSEYTGITSIMLCFTTMPENNFILLNIIHLQSNLSIKVEEVNDALDSGEMLCSYWNVGKAGSS